MARRCVHPRPYRRQVRPGKASRTGKEIVTVTIWQVEPNAAQRAAIVGLTELAIARDPRDPGPWLSLIALQHLGSADGTVRDTLARARSSFGRDVEGRKRLVRLQIEANEAKLALAEAEELIALVPEDPEALRLLGHARFFAGDWDALDDDERAEARAPTIAQLWGKARTPRDIDRVIALCRDQLETRPGDADARCYLAHALAMRGDVEEAQSIMPTDQLVRVVDLPPPDGIEPAAFRAMLAREIRANPMLEPDPQGKSVKSGLQAQLIGGFGETALPLLLKQISAAIENYVRDHADVDDHFAAHAPGKASLRSWAVVLEADGYQVPHRHPAGWLSGVYYVEAPRDDAAGCYRGPLLFGAPLAPLHDAPWPLRRIEPVPGRLVLFPSFMPHGTEPTQADGSRICVSFDIVPAQRSRQVISETVRERLQTP
jgi:hypothetical protein